MKTKRILSLLMALMTALVAFSFFSGCAEETVTMQIKYDGVRFNPKETENMLSLKIAENAAESIAYSEIGEDGFTNLVVARIK